MPDFNSSSMPARPRILIPIPTSIDPDYNHRSWKNYADAVSAAGGDPFAADPQLPEAELRTLAALADGILLPGSPADVEPSRYGLDRESGCGPVDAAREKLDWLLLDHAESTAKPVLGICYGVQSMNAWAGGTLIQDLAPLPVNHSAGAKVAIAHSAVVAPDSLLGAILAPASDVERAGDFLKLAVNSSHHQSVAIPGDAMRIASRCPEDGVIEAIEHPRPGSEGAWMIGVQWHPERSVDISEASRLLFAAFLAEASRG